MLISPVFALSTGGLIAIIVGAVCCVASPFIFVIVLYNGLVTLRNRAENAWSQIDVQLRRRYDLIPNLVETVKGYMDHEQETLTAVTRARSMCMDAEGVANQAAAENMLTQTLRSLFAVSEAYPDLKANENFTMLQEELAGTESMIARSRQFYNDCVMGYNTRIQMFPHTIIANMFHFTEREYFEIEEEEARGPVKVDFSS